MIRNAGKNGGTEVDQALVEQRFAMLTGKIAGRYQVF